MLIRSCPHVVSIKVQRPCLHLSLVGMLIWQVFTQGLEKKHVSQQTASSLSASVHSPKVDSQVSSHGRDEEPELQCNANYVPGSQLYGGGIEN